nr:immunoglobulin heavy chain junction region [Macaca mulatta]MOV39070.1 immunoglobulin heavy chain junction region [Macaca mulatta]MOV39219.1 immunoglobulin heavy chain junction region [Macaca mulatta]MOV40790.1 immunoglobulin heavy chain junction region [Macaca mulatta]MOV41032.1 immunoglobulin heavy chain junction region [Macaca mulatta]
CARDEYGSGFDYW